MILKNKLLHRYGIIASPKAEIGMGMAFIHPISIIIASNVKAGIGLKLYQNTTLGGAHSGDTDRGMNPQIGDNCTIYANSLVLGGVRLGNNVIVGANSVVLTDVPDNVICTGTPARYSLEK